MNLNLGGPKTLGIGPTQWKTAQKVVESIGQTLNWIWSTVWFNQTRGRQRVLGCSRSSWTRTHENINNVSFLVYNLLFGDESVNKFWGKRRVIFEETVCRFRYDLSFLVEAKETMCLLGCLQPSTKWKNDSAWGNCCKDFYRRVWHQKWLILVAFESSWRKEATGGVRNSKRWRYVMNYLRTVANHTRGGWKQSPENKGIAEVEKISNTNLKYGWIVFVNIIF